VELTNYNTYPVLLHARNAKHRPIVDVATYGRRNEMFYVRMHVTHSIALCSRSVPIASNLPLVIAVCLMRKLERVATSCTIRLLWWRRIVLVSPTLSTLTRHDSRSGPYVYGVLGCFEEPPNFQRVKLQPKLELIVHSIAF